MTKRFKQIILAIAVMFLSTYSFSQTVIKMEQKGGVYYIPCTVNGLDLQFIFDTGASTVSISLSEAVFMIKNGYMSESDIKGTEYYRLANGDVEEGTKIIIRELKIGKKLIYDIEASIVPNLSAPLLLGQSAIERFGKFSFDYSTNTIVLGETSSPSNVSSNNLQPSKPQIVKGKISWISITQAAELAKIEPRKIIVDIYADLCGWCKKMDKTTYSHPDIADYLNEKYYAVKFDAEYKEPITVGGKTFHYKSGGSRGGVHELVQTLLEGQISLPSAVVLDEKLSKLTIIPGYQDVEMMDKALHYFGDGFYDKGIKWGVFEKNYRSRIKN